MKKASNILACAALVLTGAMAIPLTPAQADSDEGAIVIDDVACRIPIPREGGGFTGLSLVGEGSVVISPGGSELRRCHAEVPEALRPNRGISVKNLRCFPATSGRIDEGNIVVTPSGQITASCHRNPSNPE